MGLNDQPYIQKMHGVFLHIGEKMLDGFPFMYNVYYGCSVDFLYCVTMVRDYTAPLTVVDTRDGYFSKILYSNRMFVYLCTPLLDTVHVNLPELKENIFN